MDKIKHKSKNDEDELRYAIGFTSVELEANRDGVLSDYQRHKFGVDRRDNMFIAFFAVILAVAIFGVAYGRFSAMDGLLIWIPIVLCGSTALFAAVKADELHRDLKQNAVEAAQGRVSLDITQYRSKTTYTVQLQDRTWDVKKNVFLAFKNGEPYAIYYAPFSKKILSAEWLRKR
jgi:hypothetical protein